MIAIDFTSCDVCGACVSVCPVAALKIDVNRVSVDHDLCTECLICVKVCPVSSIDNNKVKP